MDEGDHGKFPPPHHSVDAFMESAGQKVSAGHLVYLVYKDALDGVGPESEYCPSLSSLKSFERWKTEFG